MKIDTKIIKISYSFLLINKKKICKISSAYKKVPVSKGDQIRDFCYIDDAISAIFLALKSNKSSGEIFNIGLGVPIKIKSAVKTIYKIINKGHIQFGKIKYREDENMSVYPDINKARIKLNWIPKFSFNRGIKIVINSFE